MILRKRELEEKRGKSIAGEDRSKKIAKLKKRCSGRKSMTVIKKRLMLK